MNDFNFWDGSLVALFLLVFVSICVQRGMQDQRTARTEGWLLGTLDFSLSDEDEDPESQSRSLSGSNSQHSPPSSQNNSGPGDLADEAATSAHCNELASLAQQLALERAQNRSYRKEQEEERRKAREEKRRLEAVIEEKTARENALLEAVKVLQASHPESKIKWEAQEKQLRDQTQLAECRRRRCRALRQQIVRLHRAENTTVLRDYTRIVLERMTGLCDPGGKVLMSLESIADSGSRAAQQPEAQQAGSKRKWRFSKFAGKHVLVKLPSPFVSRLGKGGAYTGGLEANPKRLVAMVLNWCQHNLSIRATCRIVAYELALMQEEVQVCAERHRGQTTSTRRSFPGDSVEKKLDVFGNYCEKTLTEAIHAFNTTVDRWMSKEILSAAGIHLAFDISTFYVFHQQSTYLFAFWIKETGKDAACNPTWMVTAKEGFLPSIAVGEKLSRRLHDTEGNLFDTATTRAAAASLVLADLLPVARHPCLSLGVDGGGEGTGVDDPSSAGNCRANKNGLGSYRHEIFVTGAAFEQAMKRDGELLTQCMDLSGVPEDTRRLLKKRDQPKTLIPVTKFNSCPGTLYIRDRNEAYTRERPAWNEGKEMVVLKIRLSMDFDPMPCVALVKDGVANVFGCLKHCGHTLALHSSKLIMPHVRALASVILAVDNVWIFTRLKTVIAKIFRLDGCGPLSVLQEEVSRRLQDEYPEMFAEVQARYKNSQRFARVSEACDTRWGAVGRGAEELNTRMPELAVGMVLTFSEGLDEHRIDATLSVWSKDGFRHKGMIKMSPKIGRVVFRMNDPGFIFGTSLNAFFHMFVHNIPLTMSSLNTESSSHVMGGVGSLLRSVHFFLIRGMWLICPIPGKWLQWHELIRRLPGCLYTTKKSRDRDGWALHFPLQWKALVAAKPRKGLLMLNVSACSPRKNDASLVRHLYGPAFRPEMEGAITKLSDVINRVSKMKFDPPRNVLPKGLIRSLCSGPQDHPHERRALMVRVVAALAAQIAKDLVKQFGPVLFDPHMFYAGISCVDKVPVVDTDSQKSVYYVATDVALANAACLTGQMRELEQGYAPQLVAGEKLGHFMHGPLRDLFLDPTAQKELCEFRKARGVLLDRRWTEDRSYSRAPDKKGFTFRPNPCSIFPTLVKGSLQCAAQPKTNQRVEGGFSLASMAYRSYRRKQGPELNSETIRKKNAQNFGVIPIVQTQEFLDEFAKTSRHRRMHHTLYKKIFSPDPGETEEKYAARMREDLPQYIRNGEAWQDTNIHDDAPEIANALKRPDRNGGRKQNRRHREHAEDADDIQLDAVRDSTHSLGRRRPTPSAAPVKRWTRELLNKETMATLRDMCRLQALVVHPLDGARVTKADFVAALLADEDSHLESSNDIESQAEGNSSELPMAARGGCAADNGDDVVGADPSEAAWEREQMEYEQDTGPIESVAQGAHAPPGVSFSPAVPATVTAGATDYEHDSSKTSAELEIQAFIRDCQESGRDPFDFDADNAVAASELENFDRVMSVNAEIEADDSESDSEDAGQVIPPRSTAIEDVKRRRVGVWKREYAEALAGSSAWKPCKVMKVTKNQNREAINKCLLGTPLKSVTLERKDEDNDVRQFTVNLTGRVFYLLRTPCGVELVHLTQIYHPKAGGGEELPVLIEYYRVLATSDAIQVSDRADTNFQRYQCSSGETILTSSAGSRQLEIERAERLQQGKSELYHWGDVLCHSNATSLIGGVYWLTKADEKDWKSPDCKSGVLRCVKDKFPIGDLQSMDYVVVGSSFSDST